MEIKIRELLDMNDAMAKLRSAPLPIRTAYNLKKFIKEASTAMEFFESEKHAIYTKYSEANGGEITHVTEEYIKEINALVDSTIDVMDFKIKLSELDGIVNTNDLLAIDIIIDEDLD